jgi:hypothetical protein
MNLKKTRYDFIYTRHKLTRYVNDFLHHSKLDFKVFSEYDFGFKDQYSFASSFQYHLRRRSLLSSLSFSDNELCEIIYRCRLLRSLKFDSAVKFVAAAECVCNEFIEKEQPRSVVAPRIDTFLLDILDRKLSSTRKKYIGVWRSAFLKNNFFLTNRGELHKICNPHEDNVSELIKNVNDLTFRATSLTRTKFTKTNLLLAHGKRIMRDVTLEAIRLSGQIKYGYRELATGFHVVDYNIPLSTWFGRFSPYEIIRNVLNSSGPKIFIALQVNPESTIDYYSKNSELVNIERTILFLTRLLVGQGFAVIIKDHPNMFGRRNFLLLNELTEIPNVYLADYSISSNELLSGCDYVFTWSGTVAVQAYFSGKIPISVCSPYGLKLPGYNIVDSYLNLENTVNDLVSSNYYDIKYEDKFRLGYNILQSHALGSVFTHDQIIPVAHEFSQWIDRNIESITSS